MKLTTSHVTSNERALYLISFVLMLGKKDALNCQFSSSKAELS